MKERPILFSGEMVRAILEGRKTQTRRVLKSQPRGNYKPTGFIDKGCDYEFHDAEHEAKYWHCPYGKPGDRLWIRESWANIPETYPGNLHLKADATKDDLLWFTEMGWKWKPSIHMPRWASRITLEIVNIRVERLQDISEEDAKAEGAIPVGWIKHEEHLPHYVKSFIKLWNSINAKRGYGWDTNPWVWVIEFKKAV